MKHRYDEVEGWKLHSVTSVHSDTPGPPTVLVHGIGLSYRYLVPMAELLADELPVYVPDLPGFGKSHKTRRTLKLTELADWLARWMRALQLESAVVMGQSFGCQLVIHLAARHPELVGRAVLQGVTADPEARTLWQQFKRWRRNQNLEDNSGPSALPDYLRCGPWRIVRTYKYAVDDRPEDVLPNVRCPTLVIGGENDPIGSQQWHEQIAQLLPHGRLLVLDSVAHTINLSAPARLASAVRNFALEDDEVDAGFVLTCQSRPETATVTVDFDH
jgi:2-hydroxy-6-oxonona-2,4-dienedioate hydrolase